MIGARVDVRTGWGAEFARRVNAEVARAVAQASVVGAEAASQVASQRRRTGRMSRIEPVPVKGTPTGWAGGFKSEAFYSGFQSQGTLGSRRRKVKQSTVRRRQSVSGQARFAKVAGSKGVAPLRHEEIGRTAGRKELKRLIDQLGP